MRAREEIEKEAEDPHTIKMQRLLLEVLLDIRDEISVMKRAQGVEKWGPKL